MNADISGDGFDIFIGKIGAAKSFAAITVPVARTAFVGTRFLAALTPDVPDKFYFLLSIENHKLSMLVTHVYFTF